MYSNNQFYSLWKIFFLQCTLIIYPIFLCAVFSLFRLFSVLFKASEKIRTLMIEDCEWCDVEILDVQPIPTEKTWLTRAEDPSCSFITLSILPSYHRCMAGHRSHKLHLHVLCAARSAFRGAADRSNQSGVRDLGLLKWLCHFRSHIIPENAVPWSFIHQSKKRQSCWSYHWDVQQDHDILMSPVCL